MKFNYLLEIYDALLSEIQDSKKKTPTLIIEFVKRQAVESVSIYPIGFKKTKTNIQFNIEAKTHCLHPLAPIGKETRIENCIEFENSIPQIEEELNIQHLNKKYLWTVDRKSTKLFIIVDSKLEEIEKKELYFLYCNLILKVETATIQKRMKETISGLNAKEQIETYILKKQLALENLTTKLIKKIKAQNASELYQYSTTYSDKDCLKIIYSYVEKTIRFLEREYFKYMDKDSQVPIKTIIKTKVKIESKYNEIKLSPNNPSDQKGIEILLQNFAKIVELNLQQKITYNELLYFEELIPILHNQIKYKQKTRKKLKEILLELNLNALDFFDYYTEEINSELDNQESDTEKIKILYQYLKNTNQKQLYASNKWNAKLPSAKKQIAGWLEEEIQYLNQKRVLQSYSTTNAIHLETKIKFHTDLSVPQLSYFFGLLIQSGIIQPPTQRAIFKFISDHFKTKMTNSISTDSLNSKYYNVETATKNAVREKIIELLNFTKL